MWLVKKHGLEKAKSMLWNVSKKTKLCMIFECAGFDGAAPLNKSQEEIFQLFEDNTCFLRYEDIGSIPGWGDRHIFVGSLRIVNTPGAIIERIKPNIIRKMYRPSHLWMKDRELEAYRRLSGYDHFPTCLNSGANFIDISYCGRKVEFFDKDQCDSIIKTLKECNIKHRDITTDNLLYYNHEH
jgi:hypothetical protein